MSKGHARNRQDPDDRRDLDNPDKPHEPHEPHNPHDTHGKRAPWHRRARHHLRHSLKLRMVVVFLLMAMATTAIVGYGATRAFSADWREAARPLLADYIDRLTADIAPAGGPPDVERARALTARLPVTIVIAGPAVNWDSHPGQRRFGLKERDAGGDTRSDWSRVLQRTTADGHTLTYGIDEQLFSRRPLLLGGTIAALLLVTLVAWLFVRRMLRPLDAIGAGVRRFGAGDFDQPIALRHRRHPDKRDELDDLSATINTMGRDIHAMLEAKRALLLAISHELRSPVTRARLNAELLPETAEVTPQRAALLRDLRKIADLIADLLESERLASPHAALQREATDLPALARTVVAELGARHARAAEIRIDSDDALRDVNVDPARVRLLLRNVLDNALRHGADAEYAPSMHLRRAGNQIEITIRDHGPGVPEDELTRLAEAFHRPDSARSRHAGGVGLGLYLSRLVAQAHGGNLVVRNVNPGLEITAQLTDR